MNLRKNKGYVGIDIATSVIILLILVPIITGIIYNISKSNNITKRKTQAINIAVNSIEIAKGIEVEEINTEKLYNEIDKNTYLKDYIVEESKSYEYRLLEINSITYKLEVQVTDFNQKNKVKTVKAIVTYRINGQDESVDISNVIR